MQNKLIQLLLIAVLCLFSVGLALYLDGRVVHFSNPWKLVRDWYYSPSSQLEPDNEPVSAQPGLATESLLDYKAYEEADSFRCSDTHSIAGIEEVEKGRVMKWQNPDGSVAFGDSPPIGVEYEVINGWQEPDFFDLKARFEGVGGTPSLQSKIEVGGKAIYKVYSDYLGMDALSKSDIQVRLFSEKPDYDRYRNQVAPALHPSSPGFYSWSRNEAVVLANLGESRTLSIALHETAHVIHARNFGYMPKWFNEGMAEMFERVEVSGQLIRVRPGDSNWSKTLGTEVNIIPLVVLLNADQDQWESDQRQWLYANSWALASFLMQQKYRGLMRAFLTELNSDKCRSVDSLDYFQRHYQGGLTAMQRDLNAWISSINKPELRF